jgi:alanine racemase
MPRPIQARINLSALERNLALARRRARDSRVMAVVKANAYGHGLLRCANALRSADGFAVVELDAAVALREAGYRQTILLLEGFFSADELPLIEHYRLAAVIHSRDQIEMLSACKRDGLELHLKINSGMNRLGFRPEELGPALDALRSHPAISHITLMSHFANADTAEGVAEQLRVFRDATAGIALPRSLANSPALLRYPQTHAEWVRPGIMLYGASPFSDESAEILGLAPAMTLESKIIAVQQVEAGDRVGYAGAFKAEVPMRIGIVACGYADGYPRHAGTGAPMLVDGYRTRTLGRVSMDMLCVDVTPVPASGVGSRVVLWGEGLPVEEVAATAKTISYELLCKLAPRVRVVEE